MLMVPVALEALMILRGTALTMFPDTSSPVVTVRGYHQDLQRGTLIDRPFFKNTFHASSCRLSTSKFVLYMTEICSSHNVLD
ncbi:hypothetical protein MUK42_16457 [Musa troglodytarum]|uniref:Secreted protein n=1 Tax=Musa troglodytarum TaxID=320322 RepID=A0A9E7HKF3_9LILI|nr:hypothetical protein MUK42_16457 [Musa troglodytarum]URE31743.1 hypothetical protein MUK42_16457 [Musa troglodytarum]